MSVSNENQNKILLTDGKENILQKNKENNSNELLNQSKKDYPLKKSIKFISTKQKNQSVNLLQKKKKLKNNASSIEINKSNNGRWTDEEQNRFVEAVLKFGNDWKSIQNYVSSRDITQVRSHAQKFLMKLKKSSFLKNKGLEPNLSWTKVINFLKMILTYEQLKEVFFSVEKDNKNFKMKNLITIQNNSKLNKNNGSENDYQFFEETNSRINNDNIKNEYNDIHYYYKYNNYEKNYFKFDEIDNYYNYHKILTQEEEEKEILQKFIECFNSSSGKITLNSSFEEDSFKDEGNYNNIFLKEIPIKYNDNLI